MADTRRFQRRDAMKALTWAIGGIIGAIYAIPGIAYLIGPALRRIAEASWIPLGSTSKIELGTPTLFKATIERQTGWITDQEELSVYVQTENGRDFIAMSNICTHLGCRVRWIGDERIFFCPCHNGVFGPDGEVLDGPPPAPLDRYEVRVEEEQIYILRG